MRSVEPECVWDLGAELGEGPLWCARDRVVWFVDIKKQNAHRFDPASASGRTFTTPAPPGFLAHTLEGNFIVGLKTGLHLFDPVSVNFRPHHRVEPDRPCNRLNDGCVDADGHLWFGSMDDGEQADTGCLYRLDGDGPRVMDTGYVITNGPAFSPDGRTLYHVDTLKKFIFAFDLDAKGDPANKRVFARIEDDAGHPDGPTVDAEGCVWVGLFGGWSARRYSPAGELLATVRFPCANVTKIAFGGDDLRTVYATTARWMLDPAARQKQPLAGGLFRFRVDVPGLLPHYVRHG